NFKNFLEQQTLNTFAGLTSDEISRCIIAYEPVWAISTTLGSHPDTPQNALESIQAIREALISNFEFRISNLFLYGGSVTSANVREFLSNEGFDGVLIGSASVIKEEFVRILRQILSLTFGSKRRIIKE
ncbi:MAG: triose-phosphate isomerase, partial [Candidatus Colwellbacteria bacterium]|nr:triose-phosphate isomerase [Candidatus Colwellbacteria bacterium]